MGSPLARIQMGCPRRRIISSIDVSMGAVHVSFSRVSSEGNMARWRSPPTRTFACAMSDWAIGLKPANPSSPMPTIESHFCMGWVLHARTTDARWMRPYHSTLAVFSQRWPRWSLTGDASRAGGHPCHLCRSDYNSVVPVCGAVFTAHLVPWRTCSSRSWLLRAIVQLDGLDDSFGYRKLLFVPDD